MSFTTAQQAHVRIMRAVLATVQDSPLVLKGGTALLLCYGLDRFSEDLDFDAPKKMNLESRLEKALGSVATAQTVTRHHRGALSEGTIQRLRLALSDLNQIEGRFRPAFEEDDLFRDRTEMLPTLLLEIQESVR